MADFDVLGARKAGYSDDEILQHLNTSRKFDVEGALKSGYQKSEIIDHLAKTPAEADAPSLGGFLSNVGSSAMKFGGDIANVVAHPINALEGIGSIPVGLAEKAIGHEIGTRPPGDTSPSAAQKLDALVDHFKGRYGSLEGVKKALYEDPVGVAADASTLFGGAGEVANLAKMGKVAKVASTVSEFTDPLRLVTKGAAATARVGGQGAEVLADALRRQALKGGYNVTTDAGTVRQAAKTMGEYGASFSEQGLAKINSALADLQNKKLALVNQGAAGGLAIDPSRVELPLQPVAAGFATQLNPTADMAQIDKVLATFRKNNPGPIPVDWAEQLKEGTYKVNKYGPPPPKNVVATAAAEKALARGLKEELEYHLPELKGLNEAQEKLLDLEPILDKAVNKYANSGGFMNSLKKGLGSNLSKSIVGLSGAGAVAAHDPMIAAYGGAADLMTAVLSDPAVKSRLATWINTAQRSNPTKWGTPGMAAATSRIEQLATGLSRVPQGGAQGPSTAPAPAGPATQVPKLPLPSQGNAVAPSIGGQVREQLGNLPEVPKPEAPPTPSVSESELRRRAIAGGFNAEQAVEAARQKGYQLVQ